ncbi:MAG: hypothetical protein ABUR63_05865, partial [Verrucomicrobiota bacterium]
MSFPCRLSPGAVAWARMSVLAFLTLALAFLATGCGKSSGTANADALPVRHDAGADVSCSGAVDAQKPNGQACGCAGDCASGFCVDGVCCDTACTESCKAC